MNKHNQTALAVGGMVALILSGCATTRVDQPLVEARDEVAKVQANPDVARYAQADVDRAKSYLAAAEAADHRSDMALAAHESYLATQTARLALATADEKVAQELIAAGDSQRAQVQLSAREREAADAKARAAEAEARTADAEARTASAEATAAAAAANADSAAAESSSLRAELTELHATQTARGPMVKFGDMLFDTGADTLKPGADQGLDQMARFLKAHPERRVLAEGYTDSIGSDDYNVGLSQRRAIALKNALVMRGVDSSRIDTQGFGKGYPVATNADAGGRQLNRRVEMIISDASGQIAAR